MPEPQHVGRFRTVRRLSRTAAIAAAMTGTLFGVQLVAPGPASAAPAEPTPIALPRSFTPSAGCTPQGKALICAETPKPVGKRAAKPAGTAKAAPAPAPFAGPVTLADDPGPDPVPDPLPDPATPQVPDPSTCVNTNNYADRYFTCQIYEGITVIIEYTSEGQAVITGFGVHRYLEAITRNSKNRNWAVNFRATLEDAQGTAALRGTYSLAMGMRCVTACQVIASPGIVFRPLVKFFPQSYDFTVTSAGAAIDFPVHLFISRIRHSYVPNTTFVAESEQSPVRIRCDTQPFFRTTIGGCVNPDFSPLFRLDPTDPAVDESANHILAAQTGRLIKPWGVVGGPSLQRLTNRTQINQNRRAACRNFVKVNPTDSCDEYPFASTYQGAALQPDVSVMNVSLDDNRTAGARLGAFYSNNRIIDRDPFFVSINIGV